MLKLEPLHTPWSPQWVKERAQTPGLPKPEIIGDALTYLNKRTSQQQIANNVKTFKAETGKLIAEQRESGTPDKICAEAFLAQVKEVSATPGLAVSETGAVRFLDFGGALQTSPSRGQLPPLPDFTKRGDAISIALEYCNARAKAKEEGQNLEKVEEVKTAIARPLTAAKDSGVPDFMLEDALHETIAENGLQ